MDEEAKNLVAGEDDSITREFKFSKIEKLLLSSASVKEPLFQFWQKVMETPWRGHQSKDRAEVTPG